MKKHFDTLQNCPGAVGFDAPTGPGLPGRLTIDPRLSVDAIAWLKRRYRVSPNLELSGDALVVDIIARAMPVKGGQPRKRVACAFGQPQQFELQLQ